MRKQMSTMSHQSANTMSMTISVAEVEFLKRNALRIEILDEYFRLMLNDNEWLFKLTYLADFLLQETQFVKFIKLLKQRVYERPYQKDLLWSYYMIAMTKYGSAKLGNEILELIIELNNDIASSCNKHLQLPRIIESPWFSKRIGEMLDQTSCVKQMLQLKLLTSKPVLCMSKDSIRSCSNKAFIPYLSDAFQVISNSNDVEDMERLARVSPISFFGFKLPNRIVGHSDKIINELVPLCKKMNINLPNFTMLPKTEEIAAEYLTRNNFVNGSEKFVVMHIRERGYFDGPQHSLRNGYPSQYIPAINWLSSQGIKTIRIGHKHMTTIPRTKGLIDLTYVNYPPEVDIFLNARALFYFGCKSGPFSLADNFGTPTLAIDVVPYMSRANSLTHFLKFIDLNTNKICSFFELERRVGPEISAPDRYQSFGFQASHASKDDILNCVQEIALNLNSIINCSDGNLTSDKKHDSRFIGRIAKNSNSLFNC